MNRADVQKITGEYGLAPTKKFGQNFLINDNIINKILDASNSVGKRVLEIGPGLGAISTGLAERAESYTAVEIDAGFFRYLNDLFAGREDVELIHSDFLKLHMNEFFPVVVSNLPYYCASEILFRIAQDIKADDVFIMVQKEMAERMASSAGKSEYGAMTVTLSYYYDIDLLFHVSGDCFYPKPDVKSSFLHLKRIERDFSGDFESIFHKIVKSAFWGRRKTILTSLANAPHMDVPKTAIKAALDECGIDHSRRGESLDLEEYIKLTEAVNKYEK